MKKLLFQIKNIVIILPIILLSLFVIQSCSDDFDDVPISYPTVDFKANTSISQMKSLFKSSKTLITEDAIVEGYVVSDDTQGNFYKVLHIQNAEGTEGFKLNLDMRGIGNSYPVGQKVLIKLKGLAINNNNGYEVGKFGEGNRIDRILEPEANQYLFRSEEPIKITPKTIKISEFTEKDLNTLVKLDDVQFETTGETYALENKNTNRTIIACSDNSKVVLRTSGYSTFWNETVADKKGTITAVLSKFGSTYQLYIRDLSDISFKEERCGSSVTPPTGGGTNNSSTSFSDDFEAGSGKPRYTPVEGWTNLATKDTRQFTYKTFKENSYAEVGSHKAKGDIEAWLISPKVDLTKATNTDMSFDTQSAYADSSQAKLTIYYSEDYDGSGSPDGFTWVKVSDITDTSNPSGNTGSWIGGTAKLPKKEIFVAFKYNGNGSSATSTWRIDNVKIPSSATGGGTTTKSSDAIVSAFSLKEESKVAVIDNTKNTVSIEVKKGTDITKLTPTIAVSDKATINPTGAQNFTSPVKYTVTAEDGSTKDWTVTVTTSKDTTDSVKASDIKITGNFKSGENLTASYTFAGGSTKEGTSMFKWYLADDATGKNKTEISGETKKIYTLKTSDEGKFIAFEVTPIDDAKKTGAPTISSFMEIAKAIVSTKDILIISEYVEGSSHNKYIEIANIGTEDADLSNYSLELYTNGLTEDKDPLKLSDVQATLKPGQTIVISNKAATAYSGSSYPSSICAYSGNDAIALFKGTEKIDIFGVIGEKPEKSWDVNGTATTKDFTLQRIPSVKKGTTTWTPSQWKALPKDNVSGLGNIKSTPPTIKSSDAIVSAFSLTEQISSAALGDGTIAIMVKKGTDITKLTPTIAVSDKATINPTGAQNFTSPVKYTVTAEDGSTKDWTVTVSVDSGTTPPPSNEITSFSDDFETGAGAAKNTAPEKWTNLAQEGDRKFSYKTFQNNTYTQLGAYKANGNVTGWMISPKIDLTNASDTNMTFDTQAAYADSNQAKLTLLYSEDYDGGDSPQNFTWTELSNITDPSNPAKNTGSWISGNTNLPKKIIFVAFKYEGNSNSATSSWRVDNVKIPSSATGGGTTPPTTKSSDADIDSLSLTEEFAAANIGDGTIDITVKSGTDITKLTPTIAVSDKATINPTGAQNFTSPVKYTVTAEDGSTKDWTVTVNVKAPTIPPTLAFDTTTATVTEGTDSTYELSINLSKVANTDTTFDLSLKSGDAIDIDGFAKQSVTILKGETSKKIIVKITDDTDVETDENVVFEITNISGGDSATIGNAEFTLTIKSDDVVQNFKTYINEFAYKASSNEFVEIKMESSDGKNPDLTMYTVTLYNGKNSAEYKSTTLDKLTKTCDGTDCYFVWDSISGGIQNGDPDGIALKSADGTIEFISYGGSFTAKGGIADGVTSTDIGTKDIDSTGTSSLNLDGTTWKISSKITKGTTNNIVAPTLPDTVVFLTKSAYTITEGETAKLYIKADNPNLTADTTVDLAITGGTGDISDLDAYTQSVVIPAGKSGILLDIKTLDDTLFEGDETIVFELKNIAGGNNATIDNAKKDYTLTITDN